MQADIRQGSRFVRPMTFSDVSSVAVRDRHGNLILIMFELDGVVVSAQPDDPSFAEMARQAGYEVTQATVAGSV